MAMQKNKGIERTLYLNASMKFNSKIATKPLVIPQPKQEIPVKYLIGQSEDENILVKT